MVADLNMDIDLRICETYREQDGLAMSSRNAYLSGDERSLAPMLYGEITRLSQELIGLSAEQTSLEVNESRSRLEAAGFVVDYLAAVDTDKMTPLVTVVPGNSIIVAAKIGSTRLIDNVQIP
jgi:pantoate--beta-alanine ligase